MSTFDQTAALQRSGEALKLEQDWRRRLEAENKRLREALERIVAEHVEHRSCGPNCAMYAAKRALRPHDEDRPTLSAEEGS